MSADASAGYAFGVDDRRELFTKLDRVVTGLEHNGEQIAEGARRLRGVEEQQIAHGLHLVRLEGKIDTQNGRVSKLEGWSLLSDARLWKIALASGGGAAGIAAAIAAIAKMVP